MSKRKKAKVVDDFDRAQAHALDCAMEILHPKLFQALVELLPDPPYDFQDANPIEIYYDRIALLGTTARLKEFVEEQATLKELMLIAWAFHSVIQQVSECRLNQSETPFAKYQDLLDSPSAWQVCMFGLQSLRAWWRG